MTGPADEQVEVVDSGGRVLGVVTRAEVRARNLRHRCVFIAVLTGDHRLVVHRRSPDKDVWGDRWDLAAGGVAAVGETWDDAAARELAEELGIAGVPLVPIGDGAFDDDDVSLIARVYLAVTDQPVRFADGEVVEARTVGGAGLAALLRDEVFVPDSVEIVLPLVIERLSD